MWEGPGFIAGLFARRGRRIGDLCRGFLMSSLLYLGIIDSLGFSSNNNTKFLIISL